MTEEERQVYQKLHGKYVVIDKYGFTRMEKAVDIQEARSRRDIYNKRYPADGPWVILVLSGRKIEPTEF